MLLAAIFALGAANAQDLEDALEQPYEPAGRFGAGLVVGDPTGVSLGYRPNEWNAVEVGLGYDVLDGDLKGTADYLRSVAVLDPSPAFRVPIYVGIGAGLGRDLDSDVERIAVSLTGEDDPRTDVSARVPIGASMLFNDTPVELFVHAIPSLRVIPDRQLDLDGAFGARYYF